MVDGQSWKHVLMSDSSKNSGEAIVVVFGLRPGHTAQIEICVGPEAVSYAVGRARKMLKRRRMANSAVGQNGRALAGEEASEQGLRSQQIEDGEAHEMRSRGIPLDGLRALSKLRDFGNLLPNCSTDDSVPSQHHLRGMHRPHVREATLSAEAQRVRSALQSSSIIHSLQTARMHLPPSLPLHSLPHLT